MKWFKHDSDFRQRPYMKFINRRLGAEGVAAAYRLLEVMAESLGKAENKAGTLVLSVPYTELWLAEELGLFDEDAYHSDPSTKKLRQVLTVFNQSGLIELRTKKEDGSTTLDESNAVVPAEGKFTTITISGFVGMVDEYTARKLSKGLRSPE